MWMLMLACAAMELVPAHPMTFPADSKDKAQHTSPAQIRLRRQHQKGADPEFKEPSTTELTAKLDRLWLARLQLPPGAVQTGPLACVNPIHDVGTIWAGGTVRHTFELRNISNAPIKLKTFCSAGERVDWVAPGASLDLPITLNTEFFQGRFTKSFTLCIVDVGRPFLLTDVLEIRAAGWIWAWIRRVTRLVNSAPSAGRPPDKGDFVLDIRR